MRQGTKGPPTHRLDLTEGPWVERHACFTTQGRWVESLYGNLHGTQRRDANELPTHRLDLTEDLGGPSACFTRGRWSRAALRSFHDREGVHERETSPLCAVVGGRERSTESFHGSATAVCRGTNGPPTHRLDLTEGPWWTVPLLHDARSVGRERSTESFHGTARPCVAERTVANPPLRLDGRTLGGPSRLLHDARSVVESALPNPSTARQRPCVGGTNGPPTHRLDLTEGPWWTVPLASRRKVGGSRALYESFHGSATAVCRRNERSANPPLRLDGRTLVDRPACFTTQGRWVESALPNPSTHGTAVCRGTNVANPPLRLDGRTLVDRLLHDARSVGRDALRNPSRHGNGLFGERRSPTHRLDLTEGPWWTVPLASRRKVGGSKRSTESFHGDAVVAERTSPTHA
ncbi:hypothetical protein TNCT_185231 [Trichonephila clavata]|uniref:Uncharacterized protein n=1 Tax=Trichonephila clavata TaxID=2740835 RepID=A0A8X6KBS8_TRICU|nr:hypothetical protein TNCT_185231 [Trichonephila clavata]